MTFNERVWVDAAVVLKILQIYGVATRENLEGARILKCRDTETLAIKAHTHTNSTNVFHSVFAWLCDYVITHNTKML